jgi:hypothetical protein
MASIIVEQKIFEEAREWLNTCAATEPSYIKKKLCQLIKCHFCTGFWCGFILTVSGFNVFNIGFFDPLYGALLGAFCGYIGHISMELFYVFLNNQGVSDDTL